jgi:hypothetical protein
MNATAFERRQPIRRRTVHGAMPGGLLVRNNSRMHARRARANGDRKQINDTAGMAKVAAIPTDEGSACHPSVHGNEVAVSVYVAHRDVAIVASETSRRRERRNRQMSWTSGRCRSGDAGWFQNVTVNVVQNMRPGSLIRTGSAG